MTNLTPQYLALGRAITSEPFDSEAVLAAIRGFQRWFMRDRSNGLIGGPHATLEEADAFLSSPEGRLRKGVLTYAFPFLEQLSEHGHLRETGPLQDLNPESKQALRALLAELEALP